MVEAASLSGAGEALTTDYHRSHAPVGPERSSGWGMKRYIYAECKRDDDDDRWLLPVPLGVRHPHPRLNPPDPHARGSPLHDRDGHAWAGMLADFCHVNTMPIEPRSQGIGGIATCSRSQLQALGLWDDYDRAHCDYRPRVRRPWPVLGVIDSVSRDFRFLNPVDDGGLYDTAKLLDSIFCGRMNWMERSLASRAAQFDAVSPSFQLELKGDIEYTARALDQTQPEYWRERQQKRYEDEYFTTRLVVSVTSANGDAKKKFKVIICEPYESYILKVLDRPECRPGDAFMLMCVSEEGMAVPTPLSNRIRLGATRREKLEVHTRPRKSFLESLDYSKTPTIWLYTRFVTCSSASKIRTACGDSKLKAEMVEKRYTTMVSVVSRIVILALIGCQYEEEVGRAPLELGHPLLKDVPVLQEHIPYEHLPDILLVYDADGITTMIQQPSVSRNASSSGAESSADNDHTEDQQADGIPVPKAPPVRYRRVLPDLKEYDQALRDRQRVPVVASLVLRSEHLLGVGHHSMVHDGILQLPSPLTTQDGSGCVRVAAKTAFQDPRRPDAREMFMHEAKVHAKMPRNLQDDYTGFVKTYPIREQVPVQAVTPKFYGYYVPVEDDALKESAQSGLILLEHCGVPIDPNKLNGDDV
jgi:hypothetical protein